MRLREPARPFSSVCCGRLVRPCSRSTEAAGTGERICAAGRLWACRPADEIRAGSSRTAGQAGRGAPAFCVLLLILLTPALSRGAAIEAVGVLGNSGIAGPALVRVGGDAPTGVAVDADRTLWVGAGDGVNRLTLDGRLLERFALEPAGSRASSLTFAVLGGSLYFLGDVPGKGRALFELAMRSGATAKPLPVALPPLEASHIPHVLAAEPLGGKLVIAARVKGEKETPIVVYAVDPAQGTLEPVARLEGQSVAGVAVDAARRVIYVGTGVISAFRADGRPVDGFPVPCMKTPAIPTQFRGRLSLAGGALWDTAWYGFLSRHDLAGDGDPGRVLEWSHDLDYATQILGLRPDSAGADPLIITCAEPDAVYFAVWRRAERELRLLRRLGCLPMISSLGLARDGSITVGTARTQLGWHWDDPADAVPCLADIHVATTPVYFTGDAIFALGAVYHLKDGQNRDGPWPLLFHRRPGDRNEARRAERVPIKQPVGLSVQIKPPSRGARLFVTDAATRQVWQTAMHADHPLGLDNKNWQPLKIAGDALRAPTDVVALADGRLILADAGAVLLLEPQGDGWHAAWRMERWGEGPAQHFGGRLRLAVDGAWMVVSDTDRHRLVWIDWTERRVLAEFGRADAAGDSLARLSSPAQVAVQGERAVAADAGNQRIVKLMLRP